MQDVEILVKRINDLEKPFKAVALSDSEVEVTWKWEDATIRGLIGEARIKEVSEFRYYVTLLPNQKFKVHVKDTSKSIGATLTMGSNGAGMKFGGEFNSFFGKEIGMKTKIALNSVDHETGHAGVNKFSFTTVEIDKPVKEILSEMGYKKKLF